MNIRCLAGEGDGQDVGVVTDEVDLDAAPDEAGKVVKVLPVLLGQTDDLDVRPLRLPNAHTMSKLKHSQQSAAKKAKQHWTSCSIIWCK